MLKKFSNIFKRKLGDGDNGSDEDSDGSDGDNDNDNDDSDSIDINEIIDDINQLVSDMNCDHQWVDYDEDYLITKDRDNQIKMEQNIEKLLIKQVEGTLDELGKKMLDLMIVWTPPRPKIYGTCMGCNQSILIIYMVSNQFATIY